MPTMRELVETLCGDACAGRAPGSEGALVARTAIVDALRRAGTDPHAQPVPGCNGANVLATIPGDTDRYILIGAHYDHLGRRGRSIYRGADDNAAAVAVLVEVASALARRRPHGRGVILAAFDSEEPPYFFSPAMGSEYFARNPTVPLARIDMMVAMDLIGHRIAPGKNLPAAVTESLFVLGAERSRGTGEQIDALASAEPGLRVRRADAEVIPPLSDYHAFWTREIPFLFLTAGRSRYYHTPQDTPETLDWNKMAATARWLERLARALCARPEDRLTFVEARDDRSTLRSLIELTASLKGSFPDAAKHHAAAQQLLAQCDATGRLPERLCLLVSMALGELEKAIS
jgi:hypothetical protein